MNKNKNVLIVAILSGMFVWVVDSFVDYLLYKGSFFGVLMLDVPPEKIAVRIFLFMYFLVMAVMLSWFLSKARGAEKKVEISEQQYRHLFGTTKDGILLADAETGEITDANPFLEQLLGYSAAELNGKRIWEVSYFNKAIATLRDLEELCGKKHIRYHDLTLATKKGKDVIVDFVANVYSTGEKEVVQCNMRDITGRKAAEEKLLLFSEIIEQSPEGLVATDMEGILMFTNKAFARAHGYEPEEVAGKHISIFHTPEQMFTLRESTRALKEAGEFNGEVWHVNRNRKPFPTWMHNTLLRDELGRPVGIIGTMRDISLQKETEERLRESEERLRQALESGEFGTWGMDIKTGNAWRSLSHDQIFGYKKLLPEWNYQTFLDHVLPEDREKVESKFGRALSSRTEWDFECRIKRADGAIRWIWAQGKPKMDDNSKVVSMAGLVKDVTDRRSAWGQQK